MITAYGSEFLQRNLITMCVLVTGGAGFHRLAESHRVMIVDDYLDRFVGLSRCDGLGPRGFDLSPRPSR